MWAWHRKVLALAMVPIPLRVLGVRPQVVYSSDKRKEGEVQKSGGKGKC